MAEDDKGILGGLVESEEPWSLEETQKRIESLLKGRVKSGNIDSKKIETIAKNMSTLAGGTKTAKNIEQELKKVRKEGVKESSLSQKIHDLQKQQGKRTAAYQKDMSSKAAKEILKGGRGGGITGTINSLDSGIARVVSSFDSFDASVSGLGKALTIIPLIGGTIGALIGWMGNQIDSYRSLISVGQTFGGNMLSMNYAARDAAMNVEEFGKFVIKYSKLSAKVSAQGLATITKDVRATTRQFAHFGLSIEQANNFIATYTQQQVLQGRFEKMDDDTRRLKTANYMRQLTELAAITGKTVDQLNEERTALAENVDKFALMAAMTDKQRESFKANFDVFEAGLSILPKEMQGPLQQTALQFQRWGTIANTELGGLMANLGGPVVDSFENMMSVMNAGDPAQMEDAFADFAMSLINTGKSEEEMAKLTAFMFEGNVEEARKFVKGLQEMQLTTMDNRKAVKNAISAVKTETELKKKAAKAQIKFDEDTKGLLKIQESLRAAYGEIVKALVKALGPSITGVSGVIGEWTAKIIDWIQDDGVKDAILWITTTFKELTAEGGELRIAIDNIIGVIKWLGDNIGLVAGAFAVLVGLKIGIMFISMFKGIKSILGLAKGGSVASDLIGGKKGGMLSKLWKGAKGLGKGALRLGGTVAGGLVSGAMIGKDIYDVATAKEGQAKKEDIGGIGGGVTGAVVGGIIGSIVPGAGTMLGAAIGAGIGNWVGELIGESMDEADAEKAAIAAGAKAIRGPSHKEPFAETEEVTSNAITEPIAGGLTARELLAQLNEHMAKNNALLEGIGNATGDTASNSKKTAEALSGFSQYNIQ